MIGNPRRAELAAIPFLNDALDLILAAWNTLFNTEHNQAGHHTDITAITITMTGDLVSGGSGTFDGNVIADADGVPVEIGNLTNSENSSGIGMQWSTSNWWQLAAMPFSAVASMIWSDIANKNVSSYMAIITRDSALNVSPAIYTARPRSGSVSFKLGNNVTGERFAEVHATSMTALLGYLERGRTIALGAYQAYTPVWTAATVNPAIGDGAMVGRYSHMGTTVIATVTMVMGATTTYGTGAWFLSLPLTNASVGVSHNGFGVAVDTSVTTTHGLYVGPNTTTTVSLNSHGTTARVDATTPFTWAAGDELRFTFIYEAA